MLFAQYVLMSAIPSQLYTISKYISVSVSGGHCDGIYISKRHKLYICNARCLCNMTTEDYHAKGMSEEQLKDLYRIAVSIDEKVDEILEGIHDLADAENGRLYQAYDWGCDMGESDHE